MWSCDSLAFMTYQTQKNTCQIPFLILGFDFSPFIMHMHFYSDVACNSFLLFSVILVTCQFYTWWCVCVCCSSLLFVQHFGCLFLYTQTPAHSSFHFHISFLLHFFSLFLSHSPGVQWGYAAFLRITSHCIALLLMHLLLIFLPFYCYSFCFCHFVFAHE